jgi:hypothetical protein
MELATGKCSSAEMQRFAFLAAAPHNTGFSSFGDRSYRSFLLAQAEETRPTQQGTDFKVRPGEFGRTIYRAQIMGSAFRKETVFHFGIVVAAC